MVGAGHRSPTWHRFQCRRRPRHRLAEFDSGVQPRCIAALPRWSRPRATASSSAPFGCVEETLPNVAPFACVDVHEVRGENECAQGTIRDAVRERVTQLICAACETLSGEDSVARVRRRTETDVDWSQMAHSTSPTCARVHLCGGRGRRVQRAACLSTCPRLTRAVTRGGMDLWRQ